MIGGPGSDDLLLGPGHPLHRLQRAGLAAAVAGGLLCALGAVTSPEQFLRSYLVAYLFWIGLALGCLAILMIHHVTGGAWGAVIRRLLESGARTLPLMAVLFVPIALGLRVLYVWARPEVTAHDPLLQHKAPYLNVPFFLGRAALYFAAWIVVGRLLGRWSLEQDATLDPGPGRRLHLLSRGGLLVLGLTMTFAAVDWGMSLEPHWFSTIYGVLFMGGSVLSAFAFVIPVTALLASRTSLSRVITAEELHDLGKLLAAFVMLWAYFAFSQFLITWAANLPEEIPWYVRRMSGGWRWTALALAVFHFALPFAILLSRNVKRRPATLAAVGLCLIVMRFVDVLWMVKPAFPAPLHWLDAAAAIGVGGLWIATFVWQLEGRPLVPLHDPSLPGMA